MKHEIVALGYKQDALNPIMSDMTLDFHYGKHYAAYINNLNNLIVGTEFEEKALIDIIKTSEGGIFNNAAQAHNHELFFTQFCHQGRELVDEKLIKLVESSFANLDELKVMMSDEAKKLFGSGWVWLALDNGKLVIKSGSNAYTPLTENMIPLLAIDVWEHAYYLDYQNRRPDYINAFWDILDWVEVARRAE